MNEEGGWTPRGTNTYGWQAGLSQALSGYASASIDAEVCNPTQRVPKYTYTYYNFSYTTPEGIINAYPGTYTYNQCTNSRTGLSETTQFGYTLNVNGGGGPVSVVGRVTDPSGNNWYITFLNGGSVIKPQIVDPNGNYVVPVVQNQLTNFQDTSGNIPLTVTGDMILPNSLDSGLPQTLQYTDPNGTYRLSQFSTSPLPSKLISALVG